MTRSVITQRKMEIPTGVLIEGLQLLLVMRVNKSIMTSPIDVTMTPVDSGLVIQCVRPERDGLLTPVVPRYPLGRWIYTVVTSRWLSSSQCGCRAGPSAGSPLRSPIDYNARPMERTSVPGCVRRTTGSVRSTLERIEERSRSTGLLPGYFVIALGGATSHSITSSWSLPTSVEPDLRGRRRLRRCQVRTPARLPHWTLATLPARVHSQRAVSAG